MTTVWVDCKIPHCERAVGAQLTLTQSDIARGCHTQSFQSKGRITLGYFSRVGERMRQIPLAFALFTASPIFHSTCCLFTFPLRKPYIPLSHHSLTHASWLHYTPAKPSLWLTLQLIQLKRQKHPLCCLLLTQVKPHRGWASTTVATFQFKFYFIFLNK